MSPGHLVCVCVWYAPESSRTTSFAILTFDHWIVHRTPWSASGGGPAHWQSTDLADDRHRRGRRH
eukprot:3022018-Amphidinium_carterae.1